MSDPVSPPIRMQPSGDKGRAPIRRAPRRKRANIALWLCLAVSVMTVICFRFTRDAVDDEAVAALIMWVPLLVGVVLLLIAGVLAMIAVISSYGDTFLRSAVATLLCLGAGVVMVWEMIRAGIAVLWGGVKVAAVAGLIILPMTPWGAMAIGTWASLQEAEREQMVNGREPEWQLIQVEYAGLVPEKNPENIALKITNTSPHAIGEMKGRLCVWNGRVYAKADLPVTFEKPLESGASACVQLPLDEKGNKVLDIIEWEDPRNEDLDEGLDQAAGQPSEDAGTAADSATGEQTAADLVEAEDKGAHFRYQLQSLTDSSGEVFEIRFGNLEPKDGTPFYGITRGLTNSEWRLVTVEYLGTKTEDYPGRAAFGLKMPEDYQVASLKGKLHVIDIKKGHVEADVQLNPEQPLAAGETTVFALPAGKDSEEADKIITTRAAYDKAVGNKEQTSHIVRFKLKAMKTADGRSFSTGLLGGLNEEIKPKPQGEQPQGDPPQDEQPQGEQPQTGGGTE